MLVQLRQYKHEEVQFDDNRTTGESQTEDTVNPEAEDYFGEEMEDLDVETWDTVEHEGDPIQRRSLSIDGVTAVSVPKQPTNEDDPDLPGQTIQLRMGGGIEHVPQAEIVEVQDLAVEEEEAEGKASQDGESYGKESMDEEP
ncbi:hypothetical protein [Natrinema amylolyticum]|uniref:hypothetical protein n=1 Tax=Natrinema amylolyticum TaxID=2878679 RepID=UPI001CFABCE9|nr:hypothetical protein [Natrinema amylolyticum]